MSTALLLPPIVCDSLVRRCTKVIYGWLLLSVASLLGMFGGFVATRLLELYEVCSAIAGLGRGHGREREQVHGLTRGEGSLFRLFVLQLPIDIYSGGLLLYNFAICGTVLIFWHEIGGGSNDPRGLKQMYLVVVSALMAWSATQLPEWTSWGVLAAVSIWDLIAVLTPRGPLKVLVEEAEARNEPIPGLIYEGGPCIPPAVSAPRTTKNGLHASH